MYYVLKLIRILTITRKIKKGKTKIFSLLKIFFREKMKVKCGNTGEYYKKDASNRKAIKIIKRRIRLSSKTGQLF